MSKGTGIPATNGSFIAGADLRLKQFRIVYISADNTVTFAAAATQLAIIGVLQNKPNINEAAEVVVHGESKLVLAGTISFGEYATADSAGEGVKLTPAATTPNCAVGKMLQDGVDNDIARVFVNPQIINV